MLILGSLGKMLELSNVSHNRGCLAIFLIMRSTVNVYMKLCKTMGTLEVPLTQPVHISLCVLNLAYEVVFLYVYCNREKEGSKPLTSLMTDHDWITGELSWLLTLNKQVTC